MKKKLLVLAGIAALATVVSVVRPAFDHPSASDYLTNVLYSPQPGSPLGGSTQTHVVTGAVLTSPTKAPAPPVDPYHEVVLQPFTYTPLPTSAAYTIIQPDPTPTCAPPVIGTPTYDNTNYCR